MTGHIHSTESYSSVDGPGNRFVVFFQGCPMRCLYCHNPDTWSVEGGREVTAEELLAEYDSVKEFLKGGGLTCTGGEPCLQMDFLTELFEKAKSEPDNIKTVLSIGSLEETKIIFDAQTGKLLETRRMSYQ